MQSIASLSRAAASPIANGRPLAGPATAPDSELEPIRPVGSVTSTEADSASFSEDGLRGLRAEEQEGQAQQTQAGEPAEEQPAESDTPGTEDLTEEERAQVRELQARDAEVRAHEQAHKAAAGNLASGAPSYEYQEGPDGKDYAVGGEVGISVGEGDTPEETLTNAQRVQRAAQAPANPSAQDRAVAAQATQMASEARAEIQEQRREEEAQEPGESAGASAAADATQAYAQVQEQGQRQGQVQSRTQGQQFDQGDAASSLLDLLA